MFLIPFCLSSNTSSWHNGSLTFRWHAYEYNGSIKQLTDECSVIQHPNKISLMVTESFKLWSGLQSRDSEFETVFGFADAIEAVYKHQHPKDCTKSKFLLAPANFGCGFGCQQHVVGMGLAIAMNAGRIYVQHPGGPGKENPNEAMTNSNHCKTQDRRNMECYFEPWTNCSIQEVMKGASFIEQNGRKYLNIQNFDPLLPETAFDRVTLWAHDQHMVIVAHPALKKRSRPLFESNSCYRITVGLFLINSQD